MGLPHNEISCHTDVQVNNQLKPKNRIAKHTKTPTQTRKIRDENLNWTNEEINDYGNESKEVVRKHDKLADYNDNIEYYSLQ